MNAHSLNALADEYANANVAYLTWLSFYASMAYKFTDKLARRNAAIFSWYAYDVNKQTFCGRINMIDLKRGYDSKKSVTLIVIMEKPVLTYKRSTANLWLPFTFMQIPFTCITQSNQTRSNLINLLTNS